VEEQVYSTGTEQRVYQLIRQPGAFSSERWKSNFTSQVWRPSRLRLANVQLHLDFPTSGFHDVCGAMEEYERLYCSLCLLPS
jgi:hypothetical protein